MFPQYSKWEVRADGLVHLAGLLFSFTATWTLLVTAVEKLSPASIAGLAVYCFGLIGMFLASASYNLAQSRRLKEVLRRFDHAAIFVMIAGSYTPFAIVMGGVAGNALLIAVWAIAVLGVLIKLWFPRRFDRVSLILYLGQGWIVLFALNPLLSSIPSRALVLLVTGGVIYSLGIIFHLLERLPFHNVVWHIFVLGGAICQFLAIKTAVIQF